MPPKYRWRKKCTVDFLEKALENNFWIVLASTKNNQKRHLAHVGDAILHAATTEILSETGTMDRKTVDTQRNRLVSRIHLTRVAIDSGLFAKIDQDQSCSRALNQSQQRSHGYLPKVSRVCEGMEALIALIHQRWGYRQAKVFVKRTIIDPYWKLIVTGHLMLADG